MMIEVLVFVEVYKGECNVSSNHSANWLFLLIEHDLYWFNHPTSMMHLVSIILRLISVVFLKQLFKNVLFYYFKMIY